MGAHVAALIDGVSDRRMTSVLPIGYVTLLEAAEMLQPAMHAGVPDSSRVTELRRESRGQRWGGKGPSDR